MRLEMRLTPPRRASLRMAGLVMPWMLSRSTLRWRLAPPLPRPLPPLPRPDMLLRGGVVEVEKAERLCVCCCLEGLLTALVFTRGAAEPGGGAGSAVAANSRNCQ